MQTSQATVLEFDDANGTGKVVYDDGSVQAFDAAAFLASGLRLLRRVNACGSNCGDDDGHVGRRDDRDAARRLNQR